MNALSTIRTTNRVLGALAPRFTAGIARRILMTPHQNRPREWELPALKTAERITFRFGLAGLRWGSSGPVVLAQHGWQGRPTQFAALVAPLLAAGRQVIALEAPAHGRSPGEESHVFAFAEGILEAVGDLREVEAVIGHSMGGSAMLMALQQQRFAQRAVVVGSPASLPRVLDRFADTLALPAPAKQAFFDIVDRHVGTPAAGVDVSSFGPALGVPGLVVHDRDDDMVPFFEGEAMARHWTGAQFLATRGLGHRQVLADPAVVAQIVRFLVQAGDGSARAA